MGACTVICTFIIDNNRYSIIVIDINQYTTTFCPPSFSIKKIIGQLKVFFFVFLPLTVFYHQLGKEEYKYKKTDVLCWLSVKRKKIRDWSSTAVVTESPWYSEAAVYTYTRRSLCACVKHSSREKQQQQQE